MKKIQNRYTKQQTPAQKLLLKACLLSGASLIDAWEKWKAAVNIEEVDYPSFRLLPMLYQNLRINNIDDPLMLQLKGIYRYTWCQNQVNFTNMAKLLQSFNQAEIETLMLKGAALVVKYYQNHGVRPMNDLDFLVPCNKITTAIQLLKKLDYRAKNTQHLTENYFKYVHGAAFQNRKGNRIDLHAHVLHSACQDDADSHFWQEAVNINLAGVDTLALNPTHQLFHICIHGAADSLTWVTDAVTIINAHADSIDWDEMLKIAIQVRMTLKLKDNIEYLQLTFDIQIPNNFIQTLEEMPVTFMEKADYKFRSSEQKVGLTTSILEFWFRHWQANNYGNIATTIYRFPKSIKHYWGLRSLWQIPYHGIIHVKKTLVNKTKLAINGSASK